tara:strand:- start:1818 stop:2789 length:972 start_codon:yes stop_codon:yes gene_type:complete
MKVLITGCAGFIGFHLSKELLNNSSYKIYGIDNLNDYYDVDLKLNRLKILKKNKKFNFFKLDIKKIDNLNENFKKHRYDYVIHLAAQAGVRDSEKKPEKYKSNNIDGFFNIINCCQSYRIKHFLFASTSSIYGSQKKFPVKETFNTDSPLSFYAASKKTNESIAHSYSNIYNISCTAMRFFTVYGPYGRPDMALYLFADAITKNKKIKLFNHGKHIRDFTYIDDLVKYITILIPLKSRKKIPYEVYNIASGKPKSLKNFLHIISKYLNKKPKIINMPLQRGDVYKTHADVSKIKKLVKNKFYTDLDLGIKKFIDWYKKYNSYE